MEVITKKFYKCSFCNHEYDTEKEALSCESKAVTEDRGVKVGDLVLITGGQGEGETAKVSRIIIFDKYWGHYAWERYWHTVGVVADLTRGYGSRLLTFDSYEMVKEKV